MALRWTGSVGLLGSQATLELVHCGQAALPAATGASTRPPPPVPRGARRWTADYPEDGLDPDDRKRVRPAQLENFGRSPTCLVIRVLNVQARRARPWLLSAPVPTRSRAWTRPATVDTARRFHNTSVAEAASALRRHRAATWSPTTRPCPDLSTLTTPPPHGGPVTAAADDPTNETPHEHAPSPANGWSPRRLPALGLPAPIGRSEHNEPTAALSEWTCSPGAPPRPHRHHRAQRACWRPGPARHARRRVYFSAMESSRSRPRDVGRRGAGVGVGAHPAGSSGGGLVDRRWGPSPGVPAAAFLRVGAGVIQWSRWWSAHRPLLLASSTGSPSRAPVLLRGGLPGLRVRPGASASSGRHRLRLRLVAGPRTFAFASRRTSCTSSGRQAPSTFITFVMRGPCRRSRTRPSPPARDSPSVRARACLPLAWIWMTPLGLACAIVLRLLNGVVWAGNAT